MILYHCLGEHSSCVKRERESSMPFNPSPTFPSTCLSPDQPGYGQITPSANGRRRNRRMPQMNIHHEPLANWTVLTPAPGYQNAPPPPNPHTTQHMTPHLYASSYSSIRYSQSLPSTIPRAGPSLYASSSSAATTIARGYSARYTPYPDPSSASSHGASASPLNLNSLRDSVSSVRMQDAQEIILPPIRSLSQPSRQLGSTFALPPLSAMEDMRGIHSNDSAAVLRRLRIDDSPDVREGPSKARPPLAVAHRYSPRIVVFLRISTPID